MRVYVRRGRIGTSVGPVAGCFLLLMAFGVVAWVVSVAVYLVPLVVVVGLVVWLVGQSRR